MHEATVTASSVRRDGKGFKATLPEYGEVWLSLPDSMTGSVEWKKTYDIAFSVKPGTKGNFYNVTRVKERGEPVEPAIPLRPNGQITIAPRDIGPHVAMWEKLSMEALRAGLTGPEIIIMGIEARQAARAIVRTNLDGKLSELEDTFDDSEGFPG